jgi:hypothetical protein
MDLRSAKVGVIVEMLRPLLRGFRVTLPVIAPGLELFRTTSRFSDPPPTIWDFWHPPVAVCQLGRANRTGKPMLYCSTAFEPVFYEARPQVGDVLAIIKYETTGNLVANRVGYTPETFALLKATRAVPDYGLLDVHKYSDVGKLVNDFLAEVFCQEVPPAERWRYKISAAVAEVLLGATAAPINDLMYPTVPMWGGDDNVALKPDYALGNLRPVHAQFVRVTDVALPTMTYDHLDEARTFGPDGSIRWLGHQGSWTLRHQGEALTMVGASGGYWVAHDAAGNVVDPE